MDTAMNPDSMTYSDRLISAFAAMDLVDIFQSIRLAKDETLKRAWEEPICEQYWLWSYLFLAVAGEA